ncbi:unnamed protein product, partial [Didymodactylos carnosus]
MSLVRLYFIRHGQSEANLTLNVCGQAISSTLTSLGKEQSTLLGKRFKYENMKFDYMLCSTATRAIQTANIALEIMNVDTSKLITSAELLEQSQGIWEGINRSSAYTLEILQQLSQLHIEFCPPEGESTRIVQKRAIAYLDPYIEQAKKQSLIESREISIVIFTHANLIRAVLQYYLQSNPQHAWLIQQNNTAINEIMFNKHGTSLVKVNDDG